MTRQIPLPENVHVFPAKAPATFVIEGLRVALHGQSFAQAAVVDNLAAGYPDPVPGHFNIGVLHTALEGNAQHANYAPCTLQQLYARGYDYWALGHVHEFTHYPGPVPVVFPGNLQGRHIRETGARGAVLVSCDERGEATIERLELDVLRWHNMPIDVSLCESAADVHDRVRASLLEFLDTQDTDKPQVMRVTFEGETVMHGDLVGRSGHWRTEVLAIMSALAPEHMWLEKLRIATHRPLKRGEAGVSDDLARLLAEAAQDNEFKADILADLGDFAKEARYDLATDPVFVALESGNIDGWLDDAAAAVLHRLEREA